MSRFRGRIEDLHAAAAWARDLCHFAYGPEVGEAVYRRMPVGVVLALWTRPE